MRKFWFWLLQRLGLWKTGSIYYIGGSDVLPPPLPSDQEQEYLVQMEAGDSKAKSVLIERNLRLVVYIARRFENTGVNIEDLISIGTIGLIKAVSTYRREKNIKLATYASRCIENEILMHIRKIANQKTEISLDEPINTDWDGNELLLSDVLGTDGDLISRPLEDMVDQQLVERGVGAASGAGEKNCHSSLWLGGPPGKDAERSGGPDGNFSVLYLPPGKTNYDPPAPGNLEADFVNCTAFATL